MKIFYAILIFILGGVFGSFYTVLATRLPQKKSIIKPGSHCDKCGKPLTILELIPIFSYIFLGGKCHHCHERIDPTSTVVELFLSIFSTAAFIYYGFSYEFFSLVIILSLISIIFVSDFRYMVILDSPLIVSVILILILKYYYFGMNEVFYSVIYGLITFGVMYIFKLIGDKVFGKESLGGGDIKLSFIMGLLLGWQYGLIAIAIGSFMAFPIALYVTAKKKNEEIPFGPYLLLGLLTTFFFGKYFIKLIILK